MWEISNSLQLLSMLRAMGMGVLLCAFYDILRAMRKVSYFKSITVFFQDTVFSLVSAFAVFIFLLSVTNGELRAYILFGMVLGFILCRFSFSYIWFWVLKFLFSKVSYIYKLIILKFYSGFDKTFIALREFLTKSYKTLKKGLKKMRNLCILKGDR